MNFRGTTVLLKTFSVSYSQETTAKQKSKRSQTADGFSGQTIDFGNLQREESLQAQQLGVKFLLVQPGGRFVEVIHLSTNFHCKP